MKSSNCMRTHSVVPLLSRGCAIVARFLREETHKSRRSKFLDDFPRLFVDEYIHEPDLGTWELESRPAESPWPRNILTHGSTSTKFKVGVFH